MRGIVAPGFDEVGAVFDESVPENEPGGAFSGHVNGQQVVDVVSGVRDRRRQQWEPDTTCVIASGTKGVVATAMLMLIERGQLVLDAQVATYWPEFAAAGKEAIESPTSSRTPRGCRDRDTDRRRAGGRPRVDRRPWPRRRPSSTSAGRRTTH